MAWPFLSCPLSFSSRPLPGRVTHLDTHVTGTHNPSTPHARSKLKRKYTQSRPSTLPVSFNVTLKLPREEGQARAPLSHREARRPSCALLPPLLTYAIHPIHITTTQITPRARS
jgi:hypothetical protein